MSVQAAYEKFVGGTTRGTTPSILIENPKYAHNVGAVVRAASCYDFKQVWWTGNRVKLDIEGRGRLPREERMKGYRDVELRNSDYPFDAFGSDVTPVAVEVRPDAEVLTYFEHPENPLYVFGPEDGSISSTVLRHCHRLVIIPSNHCLNLSVAVATLMYDRRVKRQLAGLEEVRSAAETMQEDRGFIELYDGAGPYEEDR